MNQFFNSLKADLLDRRLLPFLALVAVAFLAAVGYAVLGGGGSSTATPGASSSSPQPSTKTGSIAVTPATTGTQQPVAETTHGASAQHGGSSRNPFTPLPGAKTTSTSAGASPSTSPSTSKSSGSGSSAPGSGGTTPAPAPTTQPTAPPKPRVYIHFHVSVQFGVVPAPVAGTEPQPAQLKTYKDIKLDEPFPDKANPQLVYLGVVLKTGKEAAFALTGAAILHGSATCKPSPTQCQAIVLPAGQSETLEVLEADGSTVTYELKLLTITRSVSSSASTARVHDALRAETKFARELRRHAPALSQLRYSAQRGGLVFVARKTFVARAHAADRR
jgi:hypothetical protein